VGGDSQGRIHAVWWTGGRTAEEAGIYYTYSEDGGNSFPPRQFLSKAPHDTVLHTQVVIAEDDTVYATWEGIQEAGSQIFLAYLSPSTGEWSRIHQVSDANWNTIYPVITADSENLYFAWTERKGEASRVKVRTTALVEN
jgi:hypothetical protein